MNRPTAEHAKLLLDALIDPEGFAVMLHEREDGDWRLDLTSYGQRMDGWDADGVINFLAGYVGSRTRYRQKAHA